MIEFLKHCWQALSEVAPWLMLGAGLAGLLHWLVPAQWMRRGMRGPWGVVQAVAWGIPLPLCSCGVIPAGIGLRRQGASDGAAVAFLISTPQTGVDSILVSGSVLGWPFAFLKVAMAAVTGMVGGLLVERGAKRGMDGNLDGAEKLAVVSPAGPATSGRSARDALWHAVGILRSVWLWLLIGVAASAAIQSLVPTAWIAGLTSRGLLVSMLAVLALSLPMYVCATASVPVAAGLVSAGLPPGAAFVFLFAGPATNVATMGAIGSQFGRRVLAIYLAVMIGGGLLGGWLVEQWPVTMPRGAAMVHIHGSWWQGLAAALLLALFGWFAWREVQERFGTGRLRRSGPVQHLRVGGMHCGGCADRLRAALAGVAGVEGVVIDVEGGRLDVTGTADPAALSRAIAGCGFTVEAGSGRDSRMASDAGLPGGDSRGG